jgi:hypothetical protein
MRDAMRGPLAQIGDDTLLERRLRALLGTADAIASAPTVENEVVALRRAHPSASRHAIYKLIRGRGIPGAQRQNVFRLLRALDGDSPALETQSPQRADEGCSSPVPVTTNGAPSAAKDVSGQDFPPAGSPAQVIKESRTERRPPWA